MQMEVKHLPLDLVLDKDQVVSLEAVALVLV